MREETTTDSLYGTMHDIARSPNVLQGKPGPNRWDEITEADLGENYDFEVLDHGDIIVIHPESEAALQWCYRHLPADCPRWGARGFAIEQKYSGAVIAGMERDGLVSEDDYDLAMAEHDALMHQGENL